jgi:pSer/pThr/pTyr-binding forkhead associated (FHA) protein
MDANVGEWKLRNDMVKAKLVVVGGDAKAAEVQLKLPTVIGRGKEAGLTVPHALVSRRHTEIFERDGKLFVKDLGSLNGTFVNNLRIQDEQPLEPNQLLTLGNVTFRAIYEIQSADDGAISDTDAVSLSDLETTSLDPNPESRESNVSVASFGQADSADPQNAFDETVPLDSIPQQESGGSHSNGQVAGEPETIEAGDEPESCNSESRAEDLAADTDKSFKTTYEHESPSAVLVLDELKGSAEPSVSISALDDLPAGQSAVSFSGNFEIGDQKEPISKIDPVDLDLGSDGQRQNDADDSRLGSFLKKLPR